MKKKITVIIICIFLVGICLYLFFPRTLKGKIKTNNGMSIVKNTPLIIVNDELATTDIKMKKASIEADDKELREVIDILLSVKYYKGFNIIDGKSIEIGKFSLLIYDGKDMSNITEYDSGLNEQFQSAMHSYFDGTSDYDTCLQDFYSRVAKKYPDLSH